MWPIQLAYLLFIVLRIFFSYLTLCNTSSFLTHLVQLIFNLLQHHIYKHPMYFWSTFWTVQVSVPYENLLQMQHFTRFFLKFKSKLLVKKCFLLNAAVAMAILDSISHYILHHLSSCYSNGWNIPHSLVVLLSTMLYNGDGCLEILTYYISKVLICFVLIECKQ